MRVDAKGFISPPHCFLFSIHPSTGSHFLWEIKPVDSLTGTNENMKQSKQPTVSRNIHPSVCLYICPSIHLGAITHLPGTGPQRNRFTNPTAAVRLVTNRICPINRLFSRHEELEARSGTPGEGFSLCLCLCSPPPSIFFC